MGARLDEIDVEQQSRVTVFNMGEDSPFVGAGIELPQSWWVTVDVSRADRSPEKKGCEPKAFPPLELHEYLETRLGALRAESPADAYQMLRLDISDRVMIDGRVLRGRRPTREWVVAQADAAVLKEIANNASGDSRHYLCLRIEPGDGDQIITIFVHVATQGRTLYVEFVPCVQPSVRRPYRMADTRPFPSARERLVALGVACVTCAPALLGAPGRLLRRQVHLAVARRQWWVRREAATRSWMDYGARMSVRDVGSADTLDHFQELDVRKYVQVILRQALNAIGDFLEEHDIDTSSFRSQEAVINQIVITGSYNIVGNQNTMTGRMVPPPIDSPPVPGPTPSPGGATRS
jgi:hypothetical protein